MKKLVFAAALLLGSLSFKLSDAQLRVNVNLNIGSQPEWGPVGYDYAEYYYFPDIDTYYYVPNHQYVYFNGGQWISAPVLPGRYRNFDVYHSYKVVLNQPQPWRNDAVYRVRYAGYRGRRDQIIIRDSHEDRYRNHWRGGYGDEHHDNGRHNGWYKGDDHDNGRHNGWDHGDQGDNGRHNGWGHGHGRHGDD